jgi:hypothetical protein
MAKRKVNLLRNLEIRRVDLVDRGANLDKSSGEGAHVVLFKRDAGQTDEIVVSFEKGGVITKRTVTFSKGVPIACGCGEMLPTKYADKGMELPNYCPECGAKISLSSSGEKEPTEKREGEMDLDKKTLSPEALAAFEKLEAEIAELKKAAPAPAGEKKDPPPAQEDVLKGLSPAAKAIVEKAQADAAEAQAQAKRAQEDVAKMVDEQRLAGFAKVAGTMEHIPDWTAEKGAKILKAANEKLPKEEYDNLLGVLKASDEAIRTGALFSESGRVGAGGESDPEARINAAVADLIQKKEAKDSAEALSIIMQRDPSLYGQYRKAATTKS